MSNFASGKWAYGISDRSGFRYRLKDMRKEWNGLLVGKDEWEPKHPQLDPLKVRPDAQALKNARPDQDAGSIYVNVGDNIFPPPVRFAGTLVAQVGAVTVVTS